MSEHTKIFTYQQAGLSYTVTIYAKDGNFFADVTVDHGAMDLNAVYFGDDDFSGPSATLKGPLNMSGGGSQYEGETVQWDQAIKLSDPGLGKSGTNKSTYLSEGDTFTVPLSINSLDEIDFFGIRATSTSTPEGSIKGVSGDPETTEEPDEPLHEKVFFDYGTDESGASLGGVFILAREPEDNGFGVPSLPEGTEPTFANYVSYFEELGGDISSVDSVAFYKNDAEGNLQEAFRIDAPEGGFADADAMLASYNAAIETFAVPDPGQDFIASLTTETLPENAPYDEGEHELEEANIY